MSVKPFQITDDSARSNLGTRQNDSFDTILTVADDRFKSPLEVSLSGNVLSIAASTLQKLESDGLGGTQNSYKHRIPTISGLDVLTSQSSIDLTSGDTTGSFANDPDTGLSVTSGYYVQMGIEVRSDGKLYVVWGTPAATAGAATVPSFSKSKAFPILVAKLHNNGTAGAWHFLTPAKSDIEIVKGGSGAGGGAGDTTELLTRILNDRDDTTYAIAAPYVFKSDELTGVTGTGSLSDDAYLMDSGQYVQSVQLLDEQFLLEGTNIYKARVQAYWNLSAIDLAATYQASIDGGSSWNTVSMSRVNGTDCFYGDVQFPTPANQTLYQYNVSNANALFELNATTARSLAKKFTSTSTLVFKGIEFYVNKVGSPSGFMYIQLIKDSGGAPSTNPLDIVQTTPIDISGLSAGNNTITKSISETVLPAGTYWAAVVTDSAYAASFSTGVNAVNVRINNNPSSEVAYVYNGTAWSQYVGDVNICVTASGYPLDLRLKITSGTNGSKLLGYGVFFGEDSVVGLPDLEQQTFIFSGDEDRYSFTITDFLPNPYNLKVYWQNRDGRVFTSPDFSVDGYVVTFESGTFYFPGQQIRLLFDQTAAGVVDTSDANASAIATQSARLDAVGKVIDDLKIVDLSSKVSVPYTAIINRAQIPNLASDLGVRMGINRIPTHQIFEIQNESGPNGERVFGVQGDTLGLIRLVGNWTSINDVSGVAIYSNTVGTDYAEVTFYGTGLNVMTAVDTNSRQFVASVDGGAESSGLSPSSGSNNLWSRNYPANQIINVASGLALGIHTVKIRSSSTGNVRFFGFETLNESSSIKANPGSYFVNSKELKLLAQQTVAYNSGFESGTLGTRGGNVLVYLKSDGTVGKAVTPTNSSAGYLNSADHTNEELVRIYSPREFGAGRSDDFSLAHNNSAADYAFTLDDGVTTMVGDNIRVAGSVIRLADGSAYITFTFVGTGFDVDTSSDGAETTTVHVDGSLVGNINTSAHNKITNKICSGLPYGTHIVKISKPTATYNLYINSFKVYSPKKPALPTGAVELAQYYVMADFAANTVVGLETIATGVIRKHSVREWMYVNGTGGTNDWSYDPVDLSLSWSREVTTDRLNAYAQLQIFGSGFEMRTRALSNRSNNVEVRLNGTLLTAANFPTAAFSVYGTGVAFNSTTGILDIQDASDQKGVGFRVSGLPIGSYTVKFTNLTAGIYLQVYGLDVITPVHALNIDQAAVQNTLNVGSQSINDLRIIQKPTQPQKAWAQAVGVASGGSTTSTTLVPISDMSVTLRTGSGKLKLSFTGSVTADATRTLTFQFFVDGVAVSPDTSAGQQGTSTYAFVHNMAVTIPISSGVHKVDVYWKTNAGTGYLQGTQRVLTVSEE